MWVVCLDPLRLAITTREEAFVCDVVATVRIDLQVFYYCVELIVILFSKPQMKREVDRSIVDDLLTAWIITKSLKMDAEYFLQALVSLKLTGDICIWFCLTILCFTKSILSGNLLPVYAFHSFHLCRKMSSSSSCYERLILWRNKTAWAMSSFETPYMLS
jgi:hypothetical protein